MKQEKRTLQPPPGGEAAETESFSRALLDWYDRNRRRLPWREEPSPYHVWISEIMLQQTRVEAVKGYYARFLEAFPDVRALAEADEDACLKCWEGLGYYSRARNLQKAARQILTEYGGSMPRTSAELRKLSGIGPYTSAAIASIAFGERIPAVDGNLLRIFARLALYGENIRTPAAAAEASAFFLKHMPADRPGDFNQALMDLGSGVCVPGEAPGCSGNCPLQPFCGAFREDRCAQLPVMPPKNRRKTEERTILLIRDEDRILIRRRPAKGLLAGLYEFPNLEGWLREEEAVEKARELGADPLHVKRLQDAKHIFTHKEWHMRGYELRTGSFPEDAGAADAGKPAGDRDAEKARRSGGCFAVTIRSLQEIYAIPGAYASFFQYL